MNTISTGYPIGTKLEGQFTNAEAYMGALVSASEIEKLKNDWAEKNEDDELSPGVTWETDTKQYSGKIVSMRMYKNGTIDYNCLFDTPSKYSSTYRGDTIESFIPSDSDEEGSCNTHTHAHKHIHEHTHIHIHIHTHTIYTLFIAVDTLYHS
jgi:hypothetical protein